MRALFRTWTWKGGGRNCHSRNGKAQRAQSTCAVHNALCHRMPALYMTGRQGITFAYLTTLVRDPGPKLLLAQLI